uniref:E3 ubiquitin ligase UBR4 C-terminal domain-containing protein n=1 Tax=Haptolina ericina TaxID=156174 RepID=A0A7S3AUZ1_9EUKA|mmetsp:Transcript_33846/g.76645  ORF Transcript_33846/g.76645 Transcript_33846/m.76645 type:complete len:1156 (+) Transcript_33846:1-3468(+)
MLPGACGSPRSSMEYFELLRGMMAADSRKLYAVACGALRQLCNLIDLEARRIRAQEASQMVDMAQGSVLKTLLEILQSLLELPTILTKFKRDEQLPTLLHALLCMRGLIMQKTSTSDECATRLMQMLTTLHEGSEADRRRFVAACISAMSEHAEGRAEDGRSLVFIFEQLCGLVCPEKPEPEYKLMLNKTATQEEFIRGSMTKNPYSSTAVGPLMRDVKNKICRDLDLGGLIEDDNGMELLVAGQIIKLDLTVAAVYEQVWARSTAAQAYAEGSASPMVVVYRLQGLDGEATEPIVDTLEEEGGEEQDPESEFAIADVVGEAGGLEVMMGILKRATPLLRARECSSLLLKFLQHCCKIRSNRRRMLQMQGAKELLCMLPEALSSESLCVVAERLVLTVEALLEEELADLPMPTDDDAEFPIHDGPASMEMESLSPNQGQIAMGGEAMVVVDDAEAFHDYVAIIVGALKSPVTKDAKALIKAITRLLPLVTRGNPARLRALLSHFESCTDFDRFDEAVHSSAVDAFLLECLIATCSSARNVSLAHRLKTAAVHQGLAPLAAAYLTRWLPGEPLPAEERGADTQQRWAAALARPALPLVLQLLGGLAQGHAGVQQLLLASPDLMTRLHALERQSSSATKATGTWAEALLEALRERAAAEVDRLRRATSESKRKAALDKRQQILKSMGMAVKGAAIDGVSDEHGGRAVIVAEGAASSVMEELEEENGHICVVCGEGETYRPGQTLGTYAFCKRVPLLSEAHSVAEAEAAATTSRHDACYSSVTHFNIIHYSCHREAARAERTLKQPKEEWEGATLRNSQTKCNNLFPIWGSSVSSEAYALCVEQWWTTVQSIGRVDAPRCRLLVHDTKLLLLRFALGESFSTYSKGGGRESNIKLLPYFVQMATFLLDSPAQPQRAMYKRILATWIAQEPTRHGPDSVLYMLVLSLLLHSPEEWATLRLLFLRRLLQYSRAEGRDRYSLMLPVSPTASPAIRGRSPGSGRSPALGPASSPLDSASSGGAAMLPPSAAQVVTSDTSQPAVATAPLSVFEACRPMLCFFALIERLQAILKGPRSWQPATSAKSVANEEQWVADMRERIRHCDQQVLKELGLLLREYEDEILQMNDFQEFFDVLGVLQQVLQQAESSEAFVSTARGDAASS